MFGKGIIKRFDSRKTAIKRNFKNRMVGIS